MSYQEHAPPADLEPYVACFWTHTATRRESAAAASPRPPHVVLPDGCVDVLLLRDAHRADAPRAFVVGAMTRPQQVDGVEALDVVAVRFRPGGASAFFDAPLVEWQDDDLPLAEAWRDVREFDGDAPAATRDALLAELRRRRARQGARRGRAARRPRLSRDRRPMFHSCKTPRRRTTMLFPRLLRRRSRAVRERTDEPRRPTLRSFRCRPK